MLLNPWEIFTFSGLSFRAIDFLFLTMWLLLFWHVFTKYRLKRNAFLFLFLVMGLFSVILLGTIVVPDYKIEWASLARFYQTLLWAVLALSFLNTDKDLKSVVAVIVISTSVISLYSIYLYFTRPGLHRIAGFFSAAGGEGLGRQASFNEIGALSALAILLSLCLLFWGESSQKQRIVAKVGLPLNVVGLVLTQSRSGIVACVTGLFILLFFELLKTFVFGIIKKKYLVLIALSAAIVTCIFVISFHFVAVNRLFRGFILETSEYSSIITRLTLWKKAVTTWLSDPLHFLLGYGYGSTERFIEAESAHNFFLNIALWCGLLGLMITLALLIWPLVRVGGHRCNTFVRQTVVVTFVVAFVVSIFGNVLVDPFYGSCTFLLLYISFDVSSHLFKEGTESNEGYSFPVVC